MKPFNILTTGKVTTKDLGEYFHLYILSWSVLRGVIV
jgi:hypothetical protein